MIDNFHHKKLDLLDTEGVIPEVLSYIQSRIMEYPDIDGSIAFHGTSTVTMLHILQQGVIPGSSVLEDPQDLVSKGDIFFLPNLRLRNYWLEMMEKYNLKFEQGATSLRELIETSTYYSQGVEFRHLVSEFLNIQIGTPLYKLIIRIQPNWSDTIEQIKNELNNEDAESAFQILSEYSGKSRQEIFNFLAQIYVLEGGFLIGFNENVFNEKSLRRGDDEYDIRVNYPQGLPYHTIQCIVPLAPYNSEFIRSINLKY